MVHVCTNALYFTPHQLLQIIIASDVLVIEEDLRHTSSPCSLLHFIATLGILFQIYYHKRYLKIAQQLLGPSTERATSDSEQQNSPKKHNVSSAS